MFVVQPLFAEHSSAGEDCHAQESADPDWQQAEHVPRFIVSVPSYQLFAFFR
jgi:hypothetical protein